MRSTRQLALLTATLLSGALALTGCSKKPTEAQCEEFADHFVELLKSSRDKPDARIRKLAVDKRDDLIESCVKGGTVKEVECVLAQDAITGVEANCK